MQDDLRIERQFNGDALLTPLTKKGREYADHIAEQFGNEALVNGGVYCEGSRSEDYIAQGCEEAEAFGCRIAPEVDLDAKWACRD